MSFRLAWFFNLIIKYCLPLLIWEGIVCTFSKDKEFCGMALLTPLQNILTIPKVLQLRPLAFFPPHSAGLTFRKDWTRNIWVWHNQLHQLMMRPVTFSMFEHNCALAGAPTLQPIPMSEGRAVAPLHNLFLMGKPKHRLCRVEEERLSYQAVSTSQQSLNLLSTCM